LNNYTWNHIIAEMERRDKTSTIFTHQQSTFVKEARSYYDRHCHVEACMNIESNKFKPMGKHYAWRVLMAIREVLNKEQGIYLPNTAGQGKDKQPEAPIGKNEVKKPREKKANTFNKFFDIDD